MLLTTTQILQGREIVEYKGMVFGEVVSGVNIFKDMFSGIRDIVGGRSGAYEGEIGEARDKAIEEMMSRILKKRQRAMQRSTLSWMIYQVMSKTLNMTYPQRINELMKLISELLLLNNQQNPHIIG